MFPVKSLTRDCQDDIVQFNEAEDMEYDNKILVDDELDLVMCEENQSMADSFDFSDSLISNEVKEPKRFIPIDTHYYDDDDYQYHRQNTYPRVHHPLKSMEPRILMDIKKRIRASKRAEEKAAKAGVASCVPELLACSSDTRVLINTTTRISGPVLTLVRESVPCDLPLHDRKKKKRKRRRSKKQEPFKPTLCKLSEESSSPLHSGVNDECSDKSDNGLLLTELSDVLKSLNKSQRLDFANNRSSNERMSFLDDIIHTELVNISLEDTCNNSLPFFDNSGIVDNIITNQSFMDLTESIDQVCNIDDIDNDSVETYGITNQSCSYVSFGIDAVNQDSVPNIGTQLVCTDSSHNHCGLSGSVDGASVCNSVCNQHQRHRAHHHYHTRKEHFDKRDLEQRTFSGQDMRSLWRTKICDKVHCGYESLAGDTIVDDIKSHRCDHIPALHNARIRNRYFQSDSI